MLHKLRQQTTRYQLTASNRLPSRRARQFLINYLRFARKKTLSFKLRAALGLFRWSLMCSFYNDDRISFRSGCFITGRARGTSQRFAVSRTRIKALSSEGKLFGARKSSW